MWLNPQLVLAFSNSLSSDPESKTPLLSVVMYCRNPIHILDLVSNSKVFASQQSCPSTTWQVRGSSERGTCSLSDSKDRETVYM